MSLHPSPMYRHGRREKRPRSYSKFPYGFRHYLNSELQHILSEILDRDRVPANPRLLLHHLIVPRSIHSSNSLGFHVRNAALDGHTSYSRHHLMSEAVSSFPNILTRLDSIFFAGFRIQTSLNHSLCCASVSAVDTMTMLCSSSLKTRFLRQLTSVQQILRNIPAFCFHPPDDTTVS